MTQRCMAFTHNRVIHRFSVSAGTADISNIYNTALLGALEVKSKLKAASFGDFSA